MFFYVSKMLLMKVSNYLNRDENDHNQDNKMYNDLQKAVKNIESHKTEVKSEVEEVKTEPGVKQEVPAAPSMGQMYGDGVQRVITSNQQLALQV